MIKTKDILREEIDYLQENHLSLYIPFVSKTWEIPYHLESLCNILTDLVHNPEIPLRLCISIPPRHYKSATVLHFISMYLENNAKNVVAYLGYSQTFAELMTSHAKSYLLERGILPSKKMANNNNWYIEQGGGIITRGIEGTMTGLGADVIILDDVINSYEQAYSRIQRNKVWDAFNFEILTRLNPNGSLIVIGTRWHEDDLIGRIIKYYKEYTYIRIPALCDDETTDINNRKLGEALLPERYSVEYLKDLQAKDPFMFECEYQQNPRRKEDRVFGDVHFYDTLPEGLSYHVGIDLAYTKGTHSDFSAITVLGKNCNKKYLIYTERWKTDFDASIEHLKTLQKLYPVTFLVEDNGVQKAICEMLKKNGIKINTITPVNDKLTRCQQFAQEWNRGDILIPKTIDNNIKEFLNEIEDFTGINDVHDDLVDSAVYAHKSSLINRTYSYKIF